MTTEAERTRVEIDQRLDWLVRGADGAEALFDRCRKAGTTLAAVVYAYVEDPEGVGTDALREAYNAFMTQDAGNFASDPKPVTAA